MAEQTTPEVTDTTVADAPVDSPATVDELDKLLAEFDQATNADQPADPAAVQNEREIEIAHHLNADTYRLQAEINSRRSELEQQEQYLRAQEDARDEVEAFKQIRGSLDISDDDLQGFVLARSLKDPQVNAAWLNRRDNPAAYNRMVEKLNGDLQQHVEQQRQKFLSTEAAADHFAVSQAVRGSSLGKAPTDPPPDFGRMTDAEIHAWKRDNMPGY